MLTPGEITKGMAITVHSLKREDVHHPAEGVPFAVIGVSLPYVLAKAFGAEQPMILDTRIANLMELSKSYVEGAQAELANRNITNITAPSEMDMPGIPSSILELFERMNDEKKVRKKRK